MRCLPTSLRRGLPERSKRLRAVLLALAVILSVLSSSRPAAQTARPAADRVADSVRRLAPGSPVTRELSLGQSHTYRLTLQAGQFVDLVVEQQGIDLTAALLRPDGREVVSVNAFDDGFRRETVAAIADVDGVHRVVVAPAPDAEPRGRYTIQIEPASRDAGRREPRRRRARVRAWRGGSTSRAGGQLADVARAAQRCARRESAAREPPG